MSVKVVREETGQIRLCIEGSQHDFAELCESLERGRKRNADKMAIDDLIDQVRVAAGIDPPTIKEGEGTDDESS